MLEYIGGHWLVVLFCFLPCLSLWFLCTLRTGGTVSDSLLLFGVKDSLGWNEANLYWSMEKQAPHNKRY